jgi:hypothetical protein
VAAFTPFAVWDDSFFFLFFFDGGDDEDDDDGDLAGEVAAGAAIRPADADGEADPVPAPVRTVPVVDALTEGTTTGEDDGAGGFEDFRAGVPDFGRDPVVDLSISMDTSVAGLTVSFAANDR